MKQINMEEISYHKAVLRAALLKGIINNSSYNEAIANLIKIEKEILKEERLKEIKVNKLKNKLNLYVTS